MGIRSSVTKSMGAVNDATDAFLVDKNERFSLSVALNGGVGTVVLERRLIPSASAWRIVSTHSADAELDGIASEAMELRLRCSAFTSGGPFDTRLGQ